jgi:hypothetical protein
MRTVKKILNTGFCLLIFILFLQCNIKTISDCRSKKIQLLLEDLFKKKAYYPTYRQDVEPIDSSIKYNIPIDSSKYFVYLYPVNLKIPNKEFYLHWNKSSEPTYPDSVKLREVNDPLMKNRHAHTVGVKLLEVNEDTTKLKIFLSYGTINNFAIDEGTFTYSFDEKNCKWVVLDSTIVRY